MAITAGGELKSADLWVLNGRMNYTAPAIVTAKGRVSDYPLLGFLFQVITASGLFLVGRNKGPVLVANPPRLKAYLGMNLEEQYVFLLETAWC